ncbi:hypothetical protein C8Q76DRAFT_738054 [Earliella scabrosa]|nr:hypothetical protein C8Q76DRAFT_738054 [Earliella scabrosa]
MRQVHRNDRASSFLSVFFWPSSLRDTTSSASTHRLLRLHRFSESGSNLWDVVELGLGVLWNR